MLGLVILQTSLLNIPADSNLCLCGAQITLTRHEQRQGYMPILLLAEIGYALGVLTSLFTANRNKLYLTWRVTI